MTRILYVDDEILYRDISKQFLERAGYIVTDVSSGRKAIDDLHQTQYDVIISDYQMPGMTGIDLLKIVRSEIGDIPFILFTGRGREEVLIEAIESGVDFYVQKCGDPVPLFADLIHKVTLAVKRNESKKISLKNEERLKKAEKIGKIGCWEYYADSGQIWMSEEAYQIFGLHQPAGMVPLDMIEDCISEKEQVHQALNDLVYYGKEFTLEFQILTADKSKKKFIRSIGHREDTSPGSGSPAFGIIQDITEKKVLEWDLSQKKQNFQQPWRN